jgi:hypothetical protein
MQWGIFKVDRHPFHVSSMCSFGIQTATLSVAQARYGEDDFTHTASTLTSSEKRILEREVNKLLKKHGVEKMPGQDVLYWRWHRVFKTLRRTKAGT